MKQISVVIALLIHLAVGPAFAVTVDFASLGTSVNLTTPNSLSLNGVAFSYDNYGSRLSLDTATGDQYGIYGSTYGALNLDFGAGATALSFDYALYGVPREDPAVVAVFDNGDIVTLAGLFTPYLPDDPSRGDILGNFIYTSQSSFTVASLLFAPVIDPGESTDNDYLPFFFNIGNLAYTPAEAAAPVPEPGTALLIALGLAGVAGYRVCGRRDAV